MNAFVGARYRAIQIANEFINRGIRDSRRDLTNMKLQKLLYFAQGFFLAWTGRPLIMEHFVAWKHGPVVLELYRQIVDYNEKNGYGSKRPFEESLPVDSEIASPLIDPNDEETVKVIDGVWARYGARSAGALRNLTHIHGAPWTDVYCREGKGARISNDAIRLYFHRLRRQNKDEQNLEQFFQRANDREKRASATERIFDGTPKNAKSLVAALERDRRRLAHGACGQTSRGGDYVVLQRRKTL